MNEPLITAIMVTLGDMRFVRQSYRCFKQQDYANKRLLIVTDGEIRKEITDLAKQDPCVTSLHVDGRLTLGELRNLALDHASNLSIQWDDDDLCAPTRITDQWKALRDKSAVLLTEQLHYFKDSNEVGWVVDKTGIDGTLLLDKRCRHRYPKKARGEDSDLKADLARAGLLNVTPGGIAYCRIYHGSNTWNRDHHMYRVQTMAKDEAEVKKQFHLLEKAATLYSWPKGWKPIYGKTVR